MPLKEEHIIFLHKYTNLLDTVEQACLYVKAKDGFEKSRAIQQMLPDIFSALLQLNDAHDLLKEIVHTKDDDTVTAVIGRFDSMVGELNRQPIEEPEWLNQTFNEKFSPNFLHWKETVDQLLAPYIAN